MFLFTELQKRKVLTFLLLIPLFFSFKVVAQQTSKIDSLTQALNAGAEDTLKCKTYVEIIKYYYKLGNYKAVKEYAQSTLLLAEKVKYKKGIADAYNNIGLADENLGNFKEAEKNYLASIKAREEIGGLKGMALTYNNLGNLNRVQGNFPQALNYHLKSLKIKEELKDMGGIALSYNNIGLLNNDQGNYNEALKNYDASLQFYKQVDDKNGMAMVYNNYGITQKNLDNLDEALVSYNHALSYNKEIGNKNWIANNYMNIGSIYRNKGNISQSKGDTATANPLYRQAMNAYNEAITLYETTGNKTDYCATLGNRGDLLISLNNYEDAQKNLEQALQIAMAVGVKNTIRNTYTCLSKLDSLRASLPNTSPVEKAAYWQSAYHHKIAADAVKDSMFNEEGSKQIAEMKTKYETEKKDNEIVLLNKEKDLQQLSLKQQQAALLISKLNSEKTKTEIEFLNKTKDFQELKLSKTQQDLVAQMLEAKAQKANLELEKKDKALKEEQLVKEKLYRNLIIGGSLALIFISLLLFNRYRLSKQLEQQTALINHRKQISADLHDDIGSTLSSISIYSEAMKNKYKAGDYDKAMQLAEEIGNNSREMMENMSDIVWSINPGKDDLQQISNRMQAAATNLLSQKDIATEFLMDDKLSTVLIPMQARKNFYLIFKEAINNIAKYAACKNVTVEFLNQSNHLILKISDDGKGFDTTMSPTELVEVLGGNGLKNMQLRADEINGVLKINSTLNKGTEIILTYPLVRG
ncbi:MAG: tetratricopeptide repeat protein [Bacteroidia bacterium]